MQADASLEEKYAALNRLQHAFTELHRWQPMWMYSPSVDIDVGRLILLVTPVSFASYGPTSYVGGDAATFSYVPSPPGTYASVTTVNSPTAVPEAPPTIPAPPPSGAIRDAFSADDSGETSAQPSAEDT